MPSAPLIQLSPRGEVVAVHYSSRSVAPLDVAPRDAPLFYGAYRRFAVLLRDVRLHVRARVDTGTLVVFNNQRTLHGRTAFTSSREPRYLQGCYLTRDSVFSEAELLRRKLAATSRA